MTGVAEQKNLIVWVMSAVCNEYCLSLCLSSSCPFEQNSFIISVFVSHLFSGQLWPRAYEVWSCYWTMDLEIRVVTDKGFYTEKWSRQQNMEKHRHCPLRFTENSILDKQGFQLTSFWSVFSFSLILNPSSSFGWNERHQWQTSVMHSWLNGNKSLSPGTKILWKAKYQKSEGYFGRRSMPTILKWENNI